jgi:hypothetical protein
MLLHIAAGALVALASFQDTDTTFSVNPRMRLDVSNYAGEIVVHTWARNEVRIQADHSSRDEIRIDRTSSEILVRTASWARLAEDFEIEVGEDRVGISFGGLRSPSVVDYEITVPETMALELGGPYTDVIVDGVRGEVTIKVAEGDVQLVGGRGRVAVSVVEGDIVVEEAQGDLKLFALDGEITVDRASGRIVAETTDGEIRLDAVDAENVEAISVEGDIWFAGPVRSGGLYTLTTHDGDVTVLIPPSASARVTVATWDGEFSTEFPATIPDRISGRRITFTLGSGDARIEIESFDGDIELEVWEP